MAAGRSSRQLIQQFQIAVSLEFTEDHEHRFPKCIPSMSRNDVEQDFLNWWWMGRSDPTWAFVVEPRVEENERERRRLGMNGKDERV